MEPLTWGRLLIPTCDATVLYCTVLDALGRDWKVSGPGTRAESQTHNPGCLFTIIASSPRSSPRSQDSVSPLPLPVCCVLCMLNPHQTRSCNWPVATTRAHPVRRASDLRALYTSMFPSCFISNLTTHNPFVKSYLSTSLRPPSHTAPLLESVRTKGTTINQHSSLTSSASFLNQISYRRIFGLKGHSASTTLYQRFS